VVVIASVAGGAALITRVAARVALCGVDSESVALTVNVLVPAAVGVPESTPAELNARPAGRVPALTVQAYGDVPPLAAKVKLYAAPTVPAVNGEVVEMTSVAGGGGVEPPPPPHPARTIKNVPATTINLFSFTASSRSPLGFHHRPSHELFAH